MKGWVIFSMLALLTLSCQGRTKEANTLVPFKASISQDERTKVLVLGTVHLAGSRDVIQSRLGAFPLSALDPLLDALEKFQPDFIGVEDYPPETVAWLAYREGKEALEKFLKFTKYAHLMQEQLEISWAAARDSAYTRLKQFTGRTPPEERGAVVAHLVAAYDWDSALLQWSYMPKAFRARWTGIPTAVRQALERELNSRNEVVSIGIALARRLGHQRMYPIDDGVEGDLPDQSRVREFLAELEASEVYQKSLEQARKEVQRESERFKALAMHGDLLPFYLELNAPAALDRNMDQWRLFFKTRFSSGLDRARVAMWEVRNLHMVANIRKITALKPGGRMLVIVGAAHKPFLDAYLHSLVDVEVIHLSDVALASVASVNS